MEMTISLNLWSEKRSPAFKSSTNRRSKPFSACLLCTSNTDQIFFAKDYNENKWLLDVTLATTILHFDNIFFCGNLY